MPDEECRDLPPLEEMQEQEGSNHAGERDPSVHTSDAGGDASGLGETSELNPARQPGSDEEEHVEVPNPQAYTQTVTIDKVGFKDEDVDKVQKIIQESYQAQFKVGEFIVSVRPVKRARRRLPEVSDSNTESVSASMLGQDSVTLEYEVTVTPIIKSDGGSMQEAFNEETLSNARVALNYRIRNAFEEDTTFTNSDTSVTIDDHIMPAGWRATS